MRLIHIATLNVRTLNRILQLTELGGVCGRACYRHSKSTKNTDTIIVKVEIKYHETGNGWTFISAPAWKNSDNAVV